jgi:HD-GYP domain-containing protein (c-di-GMP phosphodiesterase class II)
MTRVASDVRASVRLADLLSSVSLVSDLGFGLPAGESMRATLIATDLARRLGLPEPEVSVTFYTALLQHLGCIGYAHEAAALFGDDLVVDAAAARADVEGQWAFLRAITAGRPGPTRARLIATAIRHGDRFARDFASARCEVGSATARRLGLPNGVQRGLAEVADAWGGSAGPTGRRGDDIAPAARLAVVAATGARFDHLGGPAMAVDAVRRLAGTILDPTIAASFADHASELLRTADAGDTRMAILDIEPSPVRIVAEAGLGPMASAVGDLVDLKSVFTLGHSGVVADLATRAAGALSLADTTVERVHIAAALHDVGRVGIPDSVWEQPGALRTGDRERVRLHAYHSERILARSTTLAPLAVLAGSHHERLDGSGYHRGSLARELAMDARVLAAADVFAGMTQARPHRPATEPEVAAGELVAEAHAGRLDRDAAAAVVEAAGLVAARSGRPSAAAGLSEREIEVLRLVARGLSNREIAAHLVVSTRTAEHHVQHIYTKIGTSSRAAVALFAMEHGLLPARDE